MMRMKKRLLSKVILNKFQVGRFLLFQFKFQAKILNPTSMLKFENKLLLTFDIQYWFLQTIPAAFPADVPGVWLCILECFVHTFHSKFFGSENKNQCLCTIIRKSCQHGKLMNDVWWLWTGDQLQHVQVANIFTQFFLQIPNCRFIVMKIPCIINLPTSMM